MKTKDEFACRLIDELGGTTVVAKICGIQPPSVSEWKSNGVPQAWRRYFQVAHRDIFDAVTKNVSAA